MKENKMSDIKFLHFRNYKMNGELSNLGGITVAYQKIRDGVFKMAYAHCHPQDNFSKAIGRIKAAGRLNSPIQSQLVEYSSEKDLVADERDIQFPYRLKG